jgi:hypothetical protein
MKKKLYIDFDGVILDTIPPMYELIKKHDVELYKRNILNKEILPEEDTNRIREIINSIDWKHFLKVTPEINNSIKNINNLVETNLFDIAILTHVNSFKEMEAKFDFISKNISGEIDIICVPKSFDKNIATKNCKDSILIDDHSENLRKWEKAGGIGIKFSTKEKENCPFYQISSLDQIVTILTELK